jgi:anti-sigma B factor antagonist
VADVSCPVRMIRGVPVAAAPDRLDASTSRRLWSALTQLAERGHATLVVDLSRTQFCDSAGLRVLIGAHERACAEGGELRLVTASRMMLKMLSLAGIPRRPRPFPNLDQAVAELPAAMIAPPGPLPAPAGGIAWRVSDTRRRPSRRDRRLRPGMPTSG